MPSRPDRVVHLARGPQLVVVDLDAGARATSWQVDGIELLARDGDDPVEQGMYPMAPWAGRLRGNQVRWGDVECALPITYDRWALHGTCLSRATTLLARTDEDDVVALTASLDDHPGWPWPMSVHITWQVTADAVTTTIAVHARQEPFPAVVGWHPWFRRRLGAGGALQWEMGATERLVRGPDHLPTGDRVPFVREDGPFDDAFVVPDGRARVTWPGTLGLEISSTGGWYVVYDQRPDAVCVEPQAGPPDGLDGSHGVAEPGRPLEMTTVWRLAPA